MLNKTDSLIETILGESFLGELASTLSPGVEREIQLERLEVQNEVNHVRVIRYEYSRSGADVSVRRVIIRWTLKRYSKSYQESILLPAWSMTQYSLNTLRT